MEKTYFEVLNELVGHIELKNLLKQQGHINGLQAELLLACLCHNFLTKGKILMIFLNQTCICPMKPCLSLQACLLLSKKSSPTRAPSLSTTALNVSMRFALSSGFRLQVIPLSSTASWPEGVTSRFPGCRSPCHRLSWKTWVTAGYNHNRTD